MQLSKQQPIHSQKFTIKDVISSVSDGWNIFLEVPKVSIAYAAIFAVIGLLLLTYIGLEGFSPIALPFAGGFMLIGPVLLSGFFKISDKHTEDSESVRLSDAILALKNASKQLWIISLVCMLLFMVWITDAAILYAIMIGGDHLPYQLPWLIEIRSNVIAFEFWGSIMGSVLAFLIFSVSAFSVPLLYQNKTHIVNAISLSAKTVMRNFISSIFWGILLSVLTMTSIVFMPLFVVTLPVLSFASYSLYKKVFPFREEAIND